MRAGGGKAAGADGDHRGGGDWGARIRRAGGRKVVAGSGEGGGGHIDFPVFSLYTGFKFPIWRKYGVNPCVPIPQAAAEERAEAAAKARRDARAAKEKRPNESKCGACGGGFCGSGAKKDDYLKCSR